MSVDATLMRMVWAIVEEMRSQELLALSDTALVAALVQQVSRQTLLSNDEVGRLHGYVGDRISLIRDLADSRRALGLATR